VEPVDPALFREAMSRFASGVTVVTARQGHARFGLTASSFVSVSLDPPLVLVCVSRDLLAHPVIEESGAFAVNILGVHQLEAALRFAGLRPAVPDRFEGLDWTSGVTGSPLLKGSVASLDCRLHASHPGGDHTIYVGEVLTAVISSDEPPLLYHRRLWHRPATLPQAAPPEDANGI
jgi:flavin reductase (DIM6/NTAB) family NADH-FMN oxidoreductase RutF